MTGPASSDRRDTLILRACAGLAVAQPVPSVAIAWGGHGTGAAADAALVAVSSPVLLGVVAFGVVLAVALRRPEPPSCTFGARLRWSSLAALVEVAVVAGTVVVDGGVSAGAASFADSLDDGSALWAVVVLAIQVGLVDLRAPVALGVAWLVLARAVKPVRPRPPRPPGRPRRWPAGRTTRWSRGHRAARAG